MKNQPPIPTGIDQLLHMASVDPQFRNILIEERSKAAVKVGIQLNAHEQAILNEISEDQLRSMIKNLSAPTQKQPRPDHMPPPTGISPDVPPPKPQQPPPEVSEDFLKKLEKFNKT